MEKKGNGKHSKNKSSLWAFHPAISLWSPRVYYRDILDLLLSSSFKFHIPIHPIHSFGPSLLRSTWLILHSDCGDRRWIDPLSDLISDHDTNLDPNQSICPPRNDTPLSESALFRDNYHRLFRKVLGTSAYSPTEPVLNLSSTLHIPLRRKTII